MFASQLSFRLHLTLIEWTLHHTHHCQILLHDVLTIHVRISLQLNLWCSTPSPAAASAAKAAIEAQVTKVLEGYKELVEKSPTGRHIGPGQIKNYSLTDAELEIVRT